MKKVLLGSTGLHVSPLGLGTVKFGRNQGVKYPNSFDLPSDKDILALLECALDLGINLLDTAPAYGLSEERLGKLLQGQRHQWVISTKVGEEFENGHSSYDFSSSSVKASVERSLQRLRTDVLDVVLVHSNGDDEKIILEDQVFETLSMLKQKGHIRAFGMSTKTEQGGLLAVDHADVAMVTYNPIDTAEEKVIEYAHKKKKGIFIKKALASGHLDKISSQSPIQVSMDFIFRQAGVTSVILGTLNSEHLKEVAKAIEK